MKTSFNLTFYALLLSALLLSNCQGRECPKCPDCANETDAMYGERDDETNMENQAMENGRRPGEADNTDVNRNAPRTNSGKKGAVRPTSQNMGTDTKGDPENSGNGDGNDSEGMSSSGKNIGNNGTSEQTPYKGGTGSASSPGSRGNSGQGRPY